ncbi:MAG: glycosyltransferase [Candidatus Paceibacterota bacterium]|jgi:glycosyltransferase involved in cell wall biosynthesis
MDTEQEKSNGARKLRIAMVCDPLGDYKAGVIVSTTRFARLLQSRGHHVIFIGAKSKENREHDEHHGMKAYRFRSVPIPKSGGWYAAFPTVNEVKKVLQDEQIDVVHIILPMSAAIITVKAARALGIKIVAHSHSQPENLFMDMPAPVRPLLYRAWNQYLAWLYSKAETIIYPSEMAYNLLDHLTDEGKPSMVISNGINVCEFSPREVGDFYKRYGLPEDTVNLVFVGRLFPEKSVDTLILAMPHILKKHPKTHAMIVGGGHLRPKLEALVDDLGLRKHVTFLGLVTDEDKILAYNAGDIFVLPSFAELEGMVVLEAMACGKPILISDSEMSASRYFVDGNGFLFETANPEHLGEQALRLITDVGLREKMGQVSLENSKQFDINRSVEKLEEVYYHAIRK